jgi:hypothetical protein
MKAKLIRLLFVFLAIVVLLAVGWVWVTLHWSYSDGERAGYVQKLSRKGWLCKTWEGEIAMVTMPGAIPEKFEFSVRDDAVAQRINELAGKRVVLHYRQYKFIPTTCFGETEYFIEDVREVRETPPAPAPAPAASDPLTPAGPQGQLAPVR